MHNPPHPGEVLKGLYLKPLALTITEAAQALGTTRYNLSKIINGQTGISPDMALRLSEAFGTTPELWLNMQQSYDLWQVKQKNRTHKVRVLYRHQERLPHR